MVKPDAPKVILWTDKRIAHDWLMLVRSKPMSRDDATALALKMGGHSEDKPCI